MSLIISKEEILKLLPEIDIVSEIAEGFVNFSEGNVLVPPVGELLFTKPPGDMHIKYGYIKDDDFFVIKVASGFYNNPKIGLSSSQGLMIVMNARNGVTEAVLLDEGLLTNIRTAAAGACVAKVMAPSVIKGVGVFGAGIQARLQLEMLIPILKFKKVMVYDIDENNFNPYVEYFKNFPLEISFAQPFEIARGCNYIITSTPATSPILRLNDVAEGTHITAVGSDTPEKQELDPLILQKANMVVADSIEQCKTRGEIYHALDHQLIDLNKLIELGEILSGKKEGRSSDSQITIADLTGVAVQDIQIAKAVFKHFKKKLS